VPWVRFDDQFPIHRKVDNLTDPAFRLHVSAIFWCARNLTDGRVGENDLAAAAPRRMRKPERYVDELLEQGVWLQNGVGWVIHDYLEYQFSKEKVERERESAKKRQAKWREQHRGEDGQWT
jgi:hypothetical protein